MALTEQLLDDDIHPIDLVESVAEYNDWDFDRIADDQIAMAVEGQWRTYSITLRGHHSMKLCGLYALLKWSPLRKNTLPYSNY